MQRKKLFQRGQIGYERPWRATWIGALILIIALIIAIVTWNSDAGWTKDRISLEFVLVILGCLL